MILETVCTLKIFFQTQEEYFSRHPTGVNPVLLNDVIFAVHAAFACVITITQCFFYDVSNDRLMLKVRTKRAPTIGSLANLLKI